MSTVSSAVNSKKKKKGTKTIHITVHCVIKLVGRKISVKEADREDIISKVSESNCKSYLTAVIHFSKVYVVTR